MCVKRSVQTSIPRPRPGKMGAFLPPIGMMLIMIMYLGGLVPSVQAQIPANAFLSEPGVPVRGLDGYCEGYIYAEGYDFVDAVVWGYDPTGASLGSGYGEGGLGAWAYLRFAGTVTGEYMCETGYSAYGIDGYVNLGGDLWTFPAYLIVLPITINTFIPENNYIDPLNSGETGEGDDRGFNRNGSVRTTHYMALYGPHANTNFYAFGPYRWGNMSVEYEVGTSLDYSIPPWYPGYGNLTDAARNDWTEGPPMKLRWAQRLDAYSLDCYTSSDSVEHLQLYCNAYESTPLHPWVGVLASITYDFYIDIWIPDEGFSSVDVSYEVSGAHDGFPNYEVYIGDQPVYLYDHRTDNQTIWSLGPPEEYSGIQAYGEVQ